MLFSTTVVAKAFRRRKEDTFLEDLRGVCANAKTTLQSKSVWLSLKLRGQMLSNRLGLRSVRNFLPIHRVVQKIGVKFGSSVLGYYRLASWVIHFNIILFFCLWLPLVIVPWFDFWQERNWTDPAGNDVLVWDEVLLNFIAVNDGNRTTDRTWFFYSGYPPAYDDYEVAGMYVVLCIATYASALIALTVTIGRNILDSATPVGDMQLPVALFAWDWGVTSPQAVDEKMLGAWTGLQAEYYSSLRRADFFVGQKVEARPDGGGAWRRGCVVEIRVREGYFVELVEDRSVLNVTCDDNLMPVLICGMYPQTIRRIVGGTLSATLCAGSLVGLYMAVSYQEALNDTFTFASAIIVKGINLVIPRVQTSIVALEKIKDPRAVIRQEVMRVFFIKMCGIVFLYLSIRKMQSEAAENGQCPEFVVGFTLLQLFVIDCAGDMLITIGFAQLARMRKLAGKKEFKVSSDIINTLYRQCVSWIACLYCPMMPAISSLWTLALFFVKARCMFAVCKVPSEPVSSEESSAFYEAMLLGTLGVVTVPLFSFLNTKQQHCGPHWAGPSCTADVAACKTPLDALSDFMPDGSDSALEWVFSPLILATLAVALLSVIYLLTLTVFSKNFQIEKKMTELNSEVKDLRQLLRVATDQSQNNSPALPPAKQAAKKQPFQLRPLSPAFEDSSSVVETDEKLSASEVSTVLVGVIPGFDNELTPALLPFVDDKALRGQRKKQHVEESLPGTTAPNSS